MAVLAHPDDESLGFGAMFAKYGREGVQTHLVTATRGERGRFGDGETHPGPRALGEIREAELHAAARELGIGDVRFLDYLDGELDRAHAAEAVERVAGHLRRVRPQVVATFDPMGGYGHPDHIAICQFTTAAIVAAAMPGAGGDAPHRVAKLYYMVWSPAQWGVYQSAFKKLVSRVDDVERMAVPWPDWSITTRLDTAAHVATVWKAVECHRSQMAQYRMLAGLPEQQLRALWGEQTFYRAASLVNGGRAAETCLFEGLGV